MAKTNLDSGFLILYDWLPAFNSLSGDELKGLLFALIEYQRNGTPLPNFDDPITAIFAQMIAPTIKRRLDGLVSASKGAESSRKDTKKSASPSKNTRVSGRVEGRVEATLHPRKEEIRKAERSGAEISGADAIPRVCDALVCDTDISPSEFAQRIMESISTSP